MRGWQTADIMELAGHTVLITGGGSGIGRALSGRFAEAGSSVVVCGRRESKLREIETALPGVRTRACDLSTAAARVELVEWVIREFPQLDVLVNNAGVQRRIDLTAPESWEHTHEEIAINFEAQVHLCSLLIPYLRTQQHPAIVNVTSGLAFVPLAAVPVYCATKAAFHSFTLSLRRQLAATPIAVVEVAPPALNTDLGGPGTHTQFMALDEFIEAAMAQLEAGSEEITYGFSEQAAAASGKERAQIFERMNASR
ncbi:MAG TPA: SDR family oxidoreductase [Candidatus Eremiobacteraceae bacterium]|nr:SDR family oxidoreductase [Candidatus Eremiobacteraceae bacterium]